MPDKIMRPVISEPAREIPVAIEADVIVAGGGAAGIGAAVAAARNGARTVLVEQYGFLGGTATAALMTCMNGFRNQRPPDEIQTIRGLAQEIVDRMIALGGAEGTPGTSPYCVPFDPTAFKYAAIEMCRGAGVQLLLHTFVVGTIVERGRVNGIIVENKGGRSAIRGKIVIDASGDGDVSAWAGAPFVRAEAPQRPLDISLMFRMGNIDVPALLADVRAHPEAYAGHYPSPEGRPAPVTELERAAAEGQPIGLAGFEALMRQELGQERRASMILRPVRGEALLWGSRMAADCLDPEDLSRAEVEAWRETMEIARAMQKAPGFAQAYTIEIAPQVGVRETRRIVGDYVLTDEDVLQGQQFPDSIAVCDNATLPMDGRPRTYLTHTGYQVPYRCLLPRGIAGLLVAGRHLSATHWAFGNIRGIAVLIVVGQAAGTAAAVAVRDGVQPREVDVTKVQDLLRAQDSLVEV